MDQTLTIIVLVAALACLAAGVYKVFSPGRGKDHAAPAPKAGADEVRTLRSGSAVQQAAARSAAYDGPEDGGSRGDVPEPEEEDPIVDDMQDNPLNLFLNPETPEETRRQIAEKLEELGYIIDMSKVSFQSEGEYAFPVDGGVVVDRDDYPEDAGDDDQGGGEPAEQLDLCSAAVEAEECRMEEEEDGLTQEERDRRDDAAAEEFCREENAATDMKVELMLFVAKALREGRIRPALARYVEGRTGLSVVDAWKDSDIAEVERGREVLRNDSSLQALDMAGLDGMVRDEVERDSAAKASDAVARLTARMDVAELSRPKRYDVRYGFDVRSRFSPLFNERNNNLKR